MDGCEMDDSDANCAPHQVIPELSTRKILVTEWIDGTPPMASDGL